MLFDVIVGRNPWQPAIHFDEQYLMFIGLYLTIEYVIQHGHVEIIQEVRGGRPNIGFHTLTNATSKAVHQKTTKNPQGFLPNINDS